MQSSRRNFVKAGLGAVTLGAAGGAAWLAAGPAKPEPGIVSALAALAQIEAADVVKSSGAWRPFKVLHHLAQSVEMSLVGYPQHKSELFQRTAGAAAFAVFRRRGKMQHGLDEPIPGAPEIAATGDVSEAINRLRSALLAFEGFTGVLAPHFAYGVLSHEQYAVAHALHVNNHLLEFSLA